MENEVEIILKKAEKAKEQEFIRSPINYTGNKFRILPQLLSKMPKNIKILIDLFSGGATVGINIPAQKVIFVDSNEKVINLLKHLASSNFAKLLKSLILLINKYNLSISSVYGYKFYKEKIFFQNPNNGLKEYNKNGYYLLRNDYNELKDKNSYEANNLLYLLMVYGFNNDMRFSKNSNFNLPVGKTDFNMSNVLKLKNYIEKMQKINFEFICCDFYSPKLEELINKSDYIYMDPPYLITTAVYNEANQWNNEKEHQLLNFIDNLIKRKKKFMLSNIIEKKYIKNEPLLYWTKQNIKNIKIFPIDYHYKSASYNKKNRDGMEKEIIIILKED